ncbi:hypothetical protein D3C72_1075720 [compost metagenome]
MYRYRAWLVEVKGKFGLITRVDRIRTYTETFCYRGEVYYTYITVFCKPVTIYHFQAIVVITLQWCMVYCLIVARSTDRRCRGYGFKNSLIGRPFDFVVIRVDFRVCIPTQQNRSFTCFFSSKIIHFHRQWHRMIKILYFSVAIDIIVTGKFNRLI